jgi:hypothetical protein
MRHPSASTDFIALMEWRGGNPVSRRRKNWVDRLDPPEPEIRRVLRRFLMLDPESDAEAEAQFANAIVGMVTAGSSEGDVANYLAYLQEQLGQPVTPPPMRRYAAIGLWHIAKAALVRDAALRGDLVPVDSWRRDRGNTDPSA